MLAVEDIEDLVPEVDRDFLAEKRFDFSATRVGADVHIVIRSFEFPEAYAPRIANLLIILRAGYPNTGPDMFWTNPDVKLNNGQWPLNCSGKTKYGDLEWQQWSRHMNDRWRPGVDNLRTYVACIRRELSKGV